ncbi:cytochrome c [Gallaecimonas mangrovi]|uniref:cytochrome c n=1 Tax=Gallaecimonas mangrovi TaxID=2291597 RepID=UPI000E201DB9|nr:cytochrome c [Gallaecimonas mangrovi]
MKLLLNVLAGPALLLAASQAFAADDAALVHKGEYLSRAGDCIACHTKEGGEAFAGGKAIASPFGNIYSTNITPSKTAGIGNYSYEQFEQALRHGRRADGAFLYPAMPYPDYALLTDDDVKALYAYFMHGVKAVDTKAPKTDLSFPFSQRWGIRFWNWTFTDSDSFKPDASKSPEFNRGAYLVEGPGHCGSCHSPRGFAYQEKGYTSQDDDFLTGGDVGIWHAPSIRGGKGGGLEGWSVADITDYLASGRNRHTAVVGEMTSVIEHSMSYMSKADLTAMATYLKALPGQGNAISDDKAATDKTAKLLNSAKVGKDSGERLYLDNCGACHFTRGEGGARIFPVLNGNSLVNAEDPSGLIHVILAGSRMPSTKAGPEAVAMPGFGWRLSDEETAKLATFLRQAWSNKAGSVSASDVAKVRKTIPQKVLNESKPNVQ